MERRERGPAKAREVTSLSRQLRRAYEACTDRARLLRDERSADSHELADYLERWADLMLRAAVELPKAVIVIGLLLTATPALAQSEGATHAAIASYTVFGFIDVATTEYLIGTGTVREANPVFKLAVDRGPVLAGFIKGSAHTAIAYLLVRTHQKKPRWTFWTAVSLGVGQAYVDYHNARLVRR